MSDHVDRAARAMDPDAFADRNPQRPSAELQWAVRRKIATDHAQALDAAGLLVTRQDVIFSLTPDEREVVAQTYAMIPASPAHDAAVAARALREAVEWMDENTPDGVMVTRLQVFDFLNDYADRIECEAGESDE